MAPGSAINIQKKMNAFCCFDKQSRIAVLFDESEYIDDVC